MSVLSTAIPDAAMQPLLQGITEQATLYVTNRAECMIEMTTHGLTLLKTHCMSACTYDARHFNESSCVYAIC